MKSNCDRCGADSKDLFVESAGEFLCAKCASAEEIKEKEKAKAKLSYPTPLWDSEEIDYFSEPTVKALFALTERIETTNELLLRLIKKVENVL